MQKRRRESVAELIFKNKGDVQQQQSYKADEPHGEDQGKDIVRWVN